MKLLLINKNPAISRLIGLSAYKLGYELVELFDFEESIEDSFDIAFVDSDIYEEEKLMGLKSLCKNVIYIAPRGTNKPLGVDGVLEKPFLPTDFIAMVDNIEADIQKGDDVFEDVILDGDSETVTPVVGATQDFNEFEEFEDIEKSDLFEDLDDEPKWGEKGILDTQDIEEVKELLADEPSDGGIDLDDLSFLDENNAQSLMQDGDEQKEDELHIDPLLDEGLDFATKSDVLDDESHIDSLLEETSQGDELHIDSLLEDDELKLENIDVNSLDELKDDELDLTSQDVLGQDEDELHIDSLLEDELVAKDIDEPKDDELHIDSLLEDDELKLENIDVNSLDELKDDELDLTPQDEQKEDELDLSLEEAMLSDESSSDKSLEDELDVEMSEDLEVNEFQDNELIKEGELEEELFDSEEQDMENETLEEEEISQEETSLNDEIEVSEDDLFQDEIQDPKEQQSKVYTHSNDPFGGLSEDELKSAFGEVVESVKTATNDNQKEELKLEIQKALVGALEQTKMKEALKNMKINISISFDE